MGNKPNVLCVGFAKSGTTTLYDIMKQHPDIYLSGIKEPIFFGDDEIKRKGFDWYLKRYYPKNIKEKVIMEINPVIGKYIDSQEIKENYGKNIKIIFLVRNPINRLYSNFVMNLKNGDCFNKLEDNVGKEDLLFDKWVLDNFLDNDGNIISNDIVPKFCKSGNYYKVINNYIQTFGKDNVKVVVFEDFIKNLELECKKIFEFIGVDALSSINYNIFSNEGNRVPYNKLSIYIVRKTFKFWKNIIVKRIPYISLRFSNSLNNIMWKLPVLFSKKTSRKDMSYYSKIILNYYYKDICDKLGQLLNIDLTDKWDIYKPNISKDDFIALKLKRKYESGLIQIEQDYYNCSKKFNYKSFLKVIDSHRVISIKIINDVLNHFPEFDNLDMVLLNGSMASRTNIYDSDFDLNFLRQNNNDQSLLYELRIQYILSRVMNFRGCDRIHTIMNYTQPVKNINYKVYDDYVVINNNLKCQCYFRDNFEQTFKEQMESSRDYNILLSYIDKNIKEKRLCNWMNNFILVKDYGKYDIFKEEIAKRMAYIKNMYSRDEVLKCLEKIKYTINETINYELPDEIPVYELKKIYKSNIIVPILNLRFLINIFIDDEDNKKELINQLNIILYYQLFLNMRIKFVLKEKNYDFSSHSTKTISKEEFKRISQRLYNEKGFLKSEKTVFYKTKKIIKELEEHV